MLGFLLVYKPVGYTSFDVVREAKKILHTKTIGHAGTLDPLAEGLLLLGVNSATKALSELLFEKKSYRAKVFFGANSSTGDEEGEKTFLRGNKFSRNELEMVLPKFFGIIQQIPPVYSAVKINGKRACDRVRKGEEISLPERTVEIFSIQIISFSYPNAEILIECGSGTYIRSLVQDIGECLGTGAYLKSLIRESLGIFSLNDAISIKDISYKNLHPITAESFSLPSCEVDYGEKKRLFFGQKIPYESKTEGKCALFHNNRWFGFGKVESGILSSISLIGREQEETS